MTCSQALYPFNLLFFKTPLIHRYLTGHYRTQDSEEGGRFKKDVTIDERCYLLLIRDEGYQVPDQLVGQAC